MITEESRKEALQEWSDLYWAMIKRLQDGGSDITVEVREKAVPAQTPSSGTMTFAINMTPQPSGKRKGTETTKREG